MQILYTPMFSKRSINSDSNYVLFSFFCKELLEQRPDWHIYIPWPDSKSGFRYDCDGTFKRKNVTRIPIRFHGGRHIETMSLNSSYWMKIITKMFFHVHWCNDIEKAHFYKSLVQVGSNNFKTPIIAHHHFLIHPSMGYSMEKDEPVLMTQLLGSISSDKVIFNSVHTKNMFIDMSARYLSCNLSNKLITKSEIVSLGVVEKNYQPERSSEIITIVYNHRLQAYKRYKETFEVLNDLYKEGFKFKLIYVNTSNDNATYIKKFPFAVFKQVSTHKEYLEILKTSHMNVLNSQYETFCISAVESMMFGQLLIAPNGVTFPEITGAKDNGYPYLFSSVKEQKEILRAIFQNLSLVKKWGPVLRKHVNDNFSKSLWAKNHIELMEHEFNKFEDVYTNDDAKDAFLETMNRNKNKAVGSFLQDLYSQKFFRTSPSWPLFRALRMICQNNYKITNKRGVQYLEQNNG